METRNFSLRAENGEGAKRKEALRTGLNCTAQENLVARLREWPGLHCVRQIVDGEPLAEATPWKPAATV